MDKRAFDDAFGPPKPLTDDQVRRLSVTQSTFLAAANAVLETVPATPDRERALNLLRESKLASEAAIRFGRSILTREVLADLFGPVQAQDKLVASIWLNAVDFEDLLKYCSDILDAETKREVLQKGVYGRVWNTEVRVSKKIPAGMAKLVASDEEWEMPSEGPSSDELVRIH